MTTTAADAPPAVHCLSPGCKCIDLILDTNGEWVVCFPGGHSTHPERYPQFAAEAEARKAVLNAERRNGAPASSSSSRPPRKSDESDDLLAGPDVARSPTDRLATATATLATMAERYSAAVDPLAGDYIRRSELTMVVAPPESLKSWLMADLARATYTGGLWLGSVRIRPGKVLYFEQERARNLVYQTQHLALGWGDDLTGMVIVEPCGIDLCNPEWQRAIARMITAAKPALVVFNSFRAIFHGKPPDSSDVALALGWLGHLAERTRCAIVIVDGTNKAGAIGQLRGMAAHGDSIQKEYECDTVLHIERKRDPLGRGNGPARLFVGKQRHGIDTPAPFIFNVIPQPDTDGGVRALWLDETAIDSQIPDRPMTGPERVLLALPPDGSDRPLSELPSAADLTLGSVKNAISQLRKNGAVESPRRGFWRRTLAVGEPSSPTSYDVGDENDEHGTGRENSSHSSRHLRPSDDDDYRVAEQPPIDPAAAAALTEWLK